MSDSNYPTQFDTDVELPAVFDNITEIGGLAINGLRSAVFNIEEALGLNPQGSAADLTTRLSTALNSDGSIKASALSSIGLVTLPITDSQIATNAGIEESKLDLDYTTVQLKTWINELEVLVLSMNEKLIVDIYNLGQHVAHPSNYGRHRTQDIDGYTGKYAARNLQGVITDLDTRLIDHVTDTIDAHDASAIWVDDALLDFTADNVQTAIELLNNIGISATIAHQDAMHSNGILLSQDTFLDGEDHSYEIVASASLNTFSAGATSVQFFSVPSGLAQVMRNDRIEIVVSSIVYPFYVKEVDTTSARVYFFGVIPVGSTSATATIHRNSEETYEPSTLKLAIRKSRISGGYGGSIIQMVHPNAPYVLSNGLDVRKLTAATCNIRVKWADGDTGSIDAYSAMQSYPVAGQPKSTWTPENLAIALNTEFSLDSPLRHFPLVAFVHGGEVGIALDEAVTDGYVEIATPASNSAWNVLGFTEGQVAYSLGPRKFYIDGYAFSSVRTVVDATGETDSSFNGVKDIDESLSVLGLSGTSGIVRVSSTNANDSGTFAFNSATADTLTISEHPSFSTSASVGIKVYADYFTVATTPSDCAFYELFLGNYENESAELFGAERARYNYTAGSPDDPQKWFNITDVSRDFRAGLKRVNYSQVSGVGTLVLGDRGSGLSVTSPGERVSLPSANVEGFRFKLYDATGVNYIEFEIADDGFVGLANENAIDIDMFDRISEERYVQVGVVLHDTVRFKHLSDRRLFGTVGRRDVRDDFTRDYVSYPNSLLHGNGVIRGLNVYESAGALDAYGGEVVVDGNVFAIGRKMITIPNDLPTSGVYTYNLFVDGDGVWNLLRNDQFVSGQVSTPSLLEVMTSSDKTIVAQIDINTSGGVAALRDYRRFVSNIDGKVDLIVSGDTISGSFESLRAAVNYMTVLESDRPVSHTIAIRGTIVHSLSDGPLSLLDKTTIRGDGGIGGATYGQAIIVLVDSGTSFVVPGNDCSFENLTIRYEDDSVSISEGIVGSSSASIIGFLMRNCSMQNVAAPAVAATVLRANLLQNVTLEDCAVSFSSAGTTAGDFIIMTGALDNVSVNRCNFSFPNNTGLNNGIVCSSSASSLYVSDSAFSCASGTYYGNAALSLTGTASNIFVRGCLFSHWKDVVYGGSAATIQGLVFEHNVVSSNAVGVATATFNLSSTLSISKSSMVDNVIILNSSVGARVFLGDNVTSSRFERNTISSSNPVTSIFNASSISGVCVSHNNIAVANVTDAFIFGTGSVTNLKVEDNFLNTTVVTNALIRVRGATTNYRISIIGNYFVATSCASQPLVDFTDAAAYIWDVHVCQNVLQSNGEIGFFLRAVSITDLFVSENIFTSYSGYAASGTAVYVSGDSERVYVVNNIFKNSGSTIGVLRGLHAVSIATEAHFIISGNSFENYGGSGSEGAIHVSGCTRSVITGNSVRKATRAMKLEATTDVLLANNYLETNDGVSLLLSGANIRFMLHNNQFRCARVDPPYALIASYLTADNDAYGIISNNYFVQSHTAIADSQPAIYLDSTTFGHNHVTIVGNHFYAPHSVWPNYDLAPIKADLGDSGVRVMFNHMESLRRSSNESLVEIPTSGRQNLDYMNWGQTYSPLIPMGRAHAETASIGTGDGYSSWQFFNWFFNCDQSTYHSTCDRISVMFGKETVPVGATIISVGTRLDIATGDRTNLRIGLTRIDGLVATESVVYSETDVSTDSGIFTETLILTTPSVMTDSVFKITIRAQPDTLPFSVLAYMVQVTYIL